MLDLPIFGARSIQMDCARIVVIIRKGRSDGSLGEGETGGRGDGETGRLGDKLVVGIGHNSEDR